MQDKVYNSYRVTKCYIGLKEFHRNVTSPETTNTGLTFPHSTGSIGHSRGVREQADTAGLVSDTEAMESIPDIQSKLLSMA